MAQVVGQAGGVNDVGIAAQRLSERAAHLGEPPGSASDECARSVAGGSQNLSLGAQAAQCGGVEHARPVALEGCALGVLRGLGTKRAMSLVP